MNRLEVLARQITGARANGPSLADRGIRIVHVPSVLSLAKRKRFLMSIESAIADPTVTFIVFVGADTGVTPTSVPSSSGVGAAPPSAAGFSISYSALTTNAYFCHGADENEFASTVIDVPLGTHGKHIKRPKNFVREEAFFQSPTISEVVEAIDACPKITIAAVSGQCVAEGAELILACDYRIATRTASFAFDQIRTLGLTPCCGGTQRLPRAVGIQTAVHWIASGKNISAQNALDKGLIDHIIGPYEWGVGVFSQNTSSADNGTAATLLFATKELLADAAVTQVEVAAGPTNRSVAKRRLSATMGKIPIAVAANVIEAICRRDLTARMPKGFDAPSQALKAVMSYSSSDFKIGLKNEQDIFNEVYDSAQSHAMRHLSRAKVRAAEGPASGTLVGTNWSSAASNSSTDPSLTSSDALNPITSGLNAISTIGIIGGGVMGSSIAACFLSAGFRVIVVDVDAEQIGKCHQRVLQIFKPHLDRKRITAKQLEQRMANLTAVGGRNYFTAIKDADIVIEAVYEDQQLKQSIFRDLDVHCKPNCIIASNTASVDINRLAEVTKRPSHVVGIHFFSPAHIMQLVEIVKGNATSDETVMRLLHLTRRINKIGVVVGNAFGFVSNRLAIRGVFQAVCLVEEGAFPYQIDEYLKDFGFANGVFEMQDMAGLDVAAALLAQMPREQKMGRSVSTIPKELMAQGRFGMKTPKGGWYRYDPEEPTKPKSDITVERLCIATSDKKGIKRRTISQKEATYRFLFHIINEAALLLERGVAVRPSDIDLIFVLGFGFPYFRGGPLYYADQIGVDQLLEKMQWFACTCGRGTFPAPCKFLVDMAKHKKRFSDFNN